MEHIVLNERAVLYTTGAYLRPHLVTTASGNPVWMWVVTDFEESTHVEGFEIDPHEEAPTLEELFNKPSLIELNT